jgi:hypothetical protein
LTLAGEQIVRKEKSPLYEIASYWGHNKKLSNYFDNVTFEELSKK